MTECLIWQGAQGWGGYGTTGHEGRQWAVHRLQWTLVNGPIPDGMCVCHHCDVRLCYEETHLFLGTRSDNMRDMLAKGRGRHSVHPVTHCPEGHPYDKTWHNGKQMVRGCSTCLRARWREQKRRRKVKA